MVLVRDDVLQVDRDERDSPEQPAPDADDPQATSPPEPSAAEPPHSSVLTDRELAVLALEGRRYRRQGAKEQAVREELGLSATRYYQVLNALLDDQRALAHEPVLIARLRRLRDEGTADAPS